MLLTLVSLVILLCYLFYLSHKHKTGSLLCFLLFFFDILGVMMHKLGINGYNLIIMYTLFGVLLLSNIDSISKNIPLLWKSPISFLFILLIGVMIFHNYVIVGNALTNTEISSFQRDIFIRMVIPYLILILIANDKNIIYDIAKSVTLWGTVMLYVFYVIVGTSGIDVGDRLTIEDTTGFSSIGLSRLAAFTVIGAAVNFISVKGNKRFMSIIPLLLSLYTLLLCSQRGTIIGVGIAIFILFSVILIRNKRFKELTITIITVCFLCWIMLSKYDFGIGDRFSDLSNYESYERVNDYPKSWEIFGNNNYIWGEGSIGYYLITGRTYPHSIILELMVEYGLVGLIFAMSLVISGSIIAIRIITNKFINNTIKIIPAIWIALLFSVLVSGSFLHNAQFILLTGVIVLIDGNMRSQKEYASRRKIHLLHKHTYNPISNLDSKKKIKYVRK